MSGVSQTCARITVLEISRGNNILYADQNIYNVTTQVELQYVQAEHVYHHDKITLIILISFVFTVTSTLNILLRQASVNSLSTQFL